MSGADPPKEPWCVTSLLVLARKNVIAGSVDNCDSSGLPSTGKIRVPTNARTSDEANSLFRTRPSTSTAMASPPLLLSLRLLGSLDHGLPEHVARFLDGLRANRIQCRTQPGTGRHFDGPGLVEIEIESVVRGADSEGRPIRPSLGIDPLNGPISVSQARIRRSAFRPRRPAPSLFANPPGGDTGRLCHRRSLARPAHLVELAQNGLRTLHFEADFHMPSLLRRRA